ncbi:MAG TPA: DUF3575 domain-containing protein [Bacteroidales bacterium]|nr:DUF3575 domain-containing protein [Bacteroidales bacterium]
MKRYSYLVLLTLALVFNPFKFSGQNLNSGRNASESKTYFNKKNVVKLNTVGLAFSNLSFFYERNVLGRFSASLGFGYKYKGQNLKIFQSDDKIVKIDMGAIHGIAFAPEFRYYLQNCDNSLPSGFYIGIYLRFMKYNTDVVMDYNPPDDERSIVSGDFTLRESGYGLALGYQLPVTHNFLIDFQFFGPRYSFMSLTGDINADITDEFKGAIEDYVNTVLERFLDNYDFELKYKDSDTVQAKFKIPNFRFGVSICYAF